MTWIDALILGIVQGLAEFLPISSSGHLEIFNQILGLELNGSDALDFDATLHVATVLSTIVVLRKEFVPLCTAFFTWRKGPDLTLVWKLILSAVPVAIVGFCFKDTLESFFGGQLRFVGIFLLITAALLTFAYVFRTRPLELHRGRRPRSISWLDALVIGVAQAVAVLPGLSRSGTTIATGILIGDKREEVARFSFLMVIIPILGNALLDIKDYLTGESVSQAVGLLPLAVGFMSSFIVGCLACRWMLDIVRKGKLVYFAIYCLAVGILCICW
ncbi:MAG: undecaprenyl-diphosphate phosphatase [Bacteroides sp.]|nr:undecaprenyl-diphosphate phosphatase [Bacteroides sp.]